MKKNILILFCSLIPALIWSQTSVRRAFLDEAGIVQAETLTEAIADYLSQKASNIGQMAGFPKKVPVHPNFKNFRNVTLADLNGDGKQEILIPSMNQLRVFSWTGELLWTKTLTGTPIYPPSVAVMDGSGTLGIVQVTGGVPNNGRVYYLDVNGNDKAGFPMSFSNHWIICAPVLADVNGNGNREIIVQTRTSNNLQVIKTDGTLLWTAPLGGTPAVTPSVADIDNDGIIDIVTATSDGIMHAFSADGSIKNGFPVPGQNYSFSYQSPLLVDLEGDGQLSIVGAAHGDAPQYYVRNSNGTYREGWPVAVPDNSWTYAPPTVVDRSGNNAFEIFVGRPVGEDVAPMLFGFHPDGSQISNFPIEKAGGLESFVSVADITGDGLHDLLFGSNLMVEGQGFIHAYKTDGSGEIEGFPLRPTGFTFMNGPSLGDVNGDGLLDLVAFSYELTFTPADSAYVNVYELNIPVEEADVLFGTYKGSNDRAGFVGRKLPAGTPLPFAENWNSGSFSTNGWTFEPAQGNWNISSTGNPEPSASFGSQPTLTDYNRSVFSPVIDATQITHPVKLAFDLQLDDDSNSHTEFLKVYVWDGNEWALIGNFVNNGDIEWTTEIYNITELVQGKLFRIRFEATGENTSNIEAWHIDNILVTELNQTGNPEITLNLSDLFFLVPSFTSDPISAPFVITNSGSAPLEWSAVVESQEGWAQIQKTATVQTASPAGILDFSLAGGTAGGAPVLQYGEVVILHYDDDNFDAIGLTNGGTFSVAARFPADMVIPYDGYLLEEVELYINAPTLASNLRIWNAGDDNSPGQLIHDQSFTSSGAGWKYIALDQPLYLNGNDIWVGYTMTHAAGNFPAGCDVGPANQNGDWISTDGAVWEHLSTYGLNYNWNVRAKIRDDSCRWLTLSSYSGIIAPGQSQEIIATADPAQAMMLLFYADIHISSNDPFHPLKMINVIFGIGSDLRENPFQTVKVYPIPATGFITIEQPDLELERVRVYQPTGQLVSEVVVREEMLKTIDLSRLAPGLYALQLIGKNGKVHSRNISLVR